MLSAQPTGSPIRLGVALLAAEPLVAAAVVLVIAAISIIGLTALAATHTAASVLDRLIGETGMLVVVDPMATQDQIEASGARLRELPNVASIRLVDKTQALVRLSASARGAMTDSAVNPLPSVWVVNFALPRREAVRFGMITATARQAASALPGVQAVRVDDDWIALLDRVGDNLDRVERTGAPALLALCSIVLIGALFLAGRIWGDALAISRAARGSVAMRTSACLATVTCAAGVALAAGTALLALRAVPVIVTGEAGASQTFAMEPGQLFGSNALLAAFALLAASVAAASIGSRSTKR